MLPANRRGTVLTELLILSTLTGLALWLRWPALWTEGFHNEDAAGIAYNAHVLLHGGLPLVDTVDMKAPGSFFTSWLAWLVGGRSLAVLQQLACAWAILAAWGVYAGGRWLMNRRAGLIAALLYAVLSPITDSIDINYGAWMAAPYIWAGALAIRALRTGRGRWWLAAGAALAIAGLMKRQAALLTPVLMAAAVYGGRLPRPTDWAPQRPAIGNLGWLFGGLAVGFAPIMIFYAAHGELGAFVSNYFFSESGWKYATTQGGGDAHFFRLLDGFRGLFWFTGTVAICAILTSVNTVRQRGRSWTLTGAFLAGHLVFSFIGAAIGLRFFKGYYLQLMPAMVWLAAHPSGALHPWFDAELWRGPRRSRLRLVGLLALLIAVLIPTASRDLRALRIIRMQRETPRDADAARTGAFIKANTDPDDMIWSWGRWGWPIYFHADRMVATRFPKTLAVFTTNLTNTWRRPTEPTRFNPESDWETLIAELERDRPAFIVVVVNEPYDTFDAFKRLLREDYRVVKEMRANQFWLYRRADFELRVPPEPRRTRRSKTRRSKTQRAKPKSKSQRVKPKSRSQRAQPKSKSARGSPPGKVRPKRRQPPTRSPARPAKGAASEGTPVLEPPQP